MNPNQNDMRNVKSRSFIFVTLSVLALASIFGTRSVRAEVEGCNSERVKTVLLNGTYEKFRGQALKEIMTALGEKLQVVPPYTCPPFVAPYTGPRPPSGYVPSQGYRSPNSAPYDPGPARSGTGQVKSEPAPITADQHRESHLRTCAFRQREIEELNRGQASRYEARQAQLQRMLTALEKVSVAFVNVRQQQYDGANDVRFCVATVEYRDWQSDLVQIQSPACSTSIGYKIEKLLDKPGEFYVSWRCDR